MASQTRPAHTFVFRLVGATLMDASAYEEIERDPTATGQALLVVVLSSLAAGVGVKGWHSGASEAALFFAGTSIVALMLWAAWALVTFEIGTRILPVAATRSDVGELLRTLGFASAPGLIRVLGVVPGATGPIFLLSAVWMLATMVVAVRQALDYTSTARAVAVCGIGWILSMVIAVVLGLMFGPVLLGA